MRKRDYRDYLRDILDSIDDIESFIGGMSLEEFKKDKKTINAVVRSIEVIGEATKNSARTLGSFYGHYLRRLFGINFALKIFKQSALF